MLSSLSIERYYCNMLHVTCYTFVELSRVILSRVTLRLFQRFRNGKVLIKCK